MIEVLTENGLKISLENGLLAVSPKDLITKDLRDFIRRNKLELVSELKWQNLETLLSTDAEMKEQFEFEVSERIAIMQFDGELSEDEACKLARKTTFQMWLSLFGE
jgi:hypothetical protein